MKIFKRVCATFIAVIMVIMSCVTGLTAFAEGEPSITVTNTKANENYEFYKLLNLNWTAGADGVPNNEDDTYSYTINRTTGSNFENFFAPLIANYEVNGVSVPWADLNATQKDRAAYDYIASITSDSSELFDFTTALKRYATTNSISPAATINGSAGSTVTTNVATYGYYAMVPVDVSTGKVNDTSAVFSIDTVTPSAEIENKSSYPTLTKKIVSGASEVDAVSAAIGDTVNFKLTSAIPKMNGYVDAEGTPFYQFTITDHISTGFKAPSNFEVKFGNKVLTANEDYTITTTGSNDRT